MVKKKFKKILTKTTHSSANATKHTATMAPTTPDTQCLVYHLTYTKASNMLGRRDAVAKYGQSYKETLIMGFNLQIKNVKGVGGRRKMVHILFPVSDTRVKRKWLNINQ